MFNKSLLISILFANLTLLNALSIEDIVEKTYNNNYSLKAIDESIKYAKEQIEISSKWKNPTLTLGITDIQFDDITRRDLEPMQAQFIGISQVIPRGKKLDYEKKIATNDYQISKYLIEDKKLQYKSKIYEYIYNIKLLENRLTLFNEFKSNTKKLEDLLVQLYKYNKASQTQILKAQILYEELNLKSQKLKTILNTVKLKLEQITYKKIENINTKIKIENIKLSTNINSHPKILSLLQSSKKLDNISQLEKEKKNSDIKMSLTYFSRDSKFEDYLNIAFAIPLSTYGTEDLKAKKAKFKSIEFNHQITDVKHNFLNNIKIYQQNIDDSITTLNIINKNIIPKFKQLQEVLETYNSFNTSKMIDSKSLINNFNEIIKYKLKAVDEKEKYFNAIAKSIYFTKGI